MNKLAILIIAVFIFLYGMINFYIGHRGWQAFGAFIPQSLMNVYWTVFWVVAVAYLLGRLGQRFLPASVTYWLTLIGAYWLAAMLYFVLLLVFIDLIRLLNKWLYILPAGVYENPVFLPAMGLVVLAFVLGLLVYGTYNARQPIVNRYQITIPKSAGDLKQLHAVMVSDIHLGEIVDNQRLTKMVEMISQLKPDIIFLAGDTIDENVGPFVEQKMEKTFQRLNPKYGIIAVVGNHEYIGGQTDEAVHYLHEGGIQVLRDQYLKIGDDFYVVGRDDLSKNRMGKAPRAQLSQLMQGVDRSLPIIVLDHQPVQLAEAEKQGVDLQLSGHTHRGQLFPNQFITRLIYEDDWGYLKKGNLQVIVSSGFGTWGPPIRVGNKPEVVDLIIKFAQ